MPIQHTYYDDNWCVEPTNNSEYCYANGSNNYYGME